jgi:putative DNA primase/helicase
MSEAVEYVEGSPGWRKEQLRLATLNGKAVKLKRKRKADDASDAALTDAFVEAHGEHLRFVKAWGKWFHWTGKVWQHERTQLPLDLAKGFCQERGHGQAKTISAVQALASADRQVAATIEQWDTDPMVLNTPAGIVDLCTAEMRSHDPGAHLTKITGTAPSGAACPQWRAFLETVFKGDAELIGYVQRVLGYSLTGETREQKMLFAYGTGGNGKSVLVDTVAGIMGDYHTTAPIETFTASMGDRHPTELADLVGARLVTAIETEQGRAWAEARIKTLTGGDRVKARFMRKDFFEFRPQFKLLIAGNHQPVLRTVDEAIKRRFNLLPFTVTIEPGKRDPELASKLKAEWPAILGWMIEGCLAWQQDGLQSPDAVIAATSRYLETQDAMGAWIDECCDVGPAYRQRASELFRSWQAYAERIGEQAGSLKTFGPALEGKGYPRAPSRKAGSVYIGLRLKEPDELQGV